MDRRLELQAIFLLFCPNVYFQPPNGTEMQYPAIVYSLDDVETEFADNVPYRRTKRWQVTIIDWDADQPLAEMISALPMCRFDRHFTQDDLNHDVYNLFF